MDHEAPLLLGVFAPHERALPALQELEAACAALARADGLGARVEALERLAAWVRERDARLPWPAGEADPGGGDPAFRRLGVLAVVLERSPAARDALRGALEDALLQGEAVALAAEAGLSSQRGVLQEALERLQRRVLPAPRDERDLERLLARLLPDEEAAEWLERAPLGLLRRIAAAVPLPPRALESARTALHEALTLLAARVEAVGLARALRARRASEPVRGSAWHRLPRETERLLALAPGTPQAEAAERAWRATIAQCRAGNAAVLEHLEQTGISVDLVFLLEIAERMLARMELCAAVLLAPGPERGARTRELAVALARARAAGASLRQLAQDSSRAAWSSARAGAASTTSRPRAASTPGCGCGRSAAGCSPSAPRRSSC